MKQEKKYKEKTHPLFAWVFVSRAAFIAALITAQQVNLMTGNNYVLENVLK